MGIDFKNPVFVICTDRFNPDSAVADAAWSEPGVSREWRRDVRVQFRSRCNNLAIPRACIETATQRTGHGCLLRGTNPLASLRKGRPRLAEYVSIAESGFKEKQRASFALRKRIPNRYQPSAGSVRKIGSNVQS